MKIEIGTVKGFQDFLPPESIKRQAVQKVIEKYFQLYGFIPIETPIIEFDELMKPEALPGEQEDEAVSDRFRLKDRAGRNLGLRYEFTFQLSRIFQQNPNIKLPFRRYQIGSLFRDEPVSADRFRQFTQCDVDIVGSDSIKSDAEILALVSDILKYLDIEAEIQVNNRKLLSSIIESLEIKNIKEVMRELDKLEKIGEDNVKSNLKKYLDSNKILTLFKMLEKGLPFFKENAFDGAQDLLDLQKECLLYGVKIKFNPYLMRGLAYYTGNIFEVKQPGKGSIAGGGRYDKLVGKFIGRDIPAVGISFGLERITGLASIKPDSIPKAILISIGQEKASIQLARNLRKSNVSCIIFQDKPGKALEYANAQSIPYSIFIGQDEVAKKKFKLKDMQSGGEKLLTEKQLLAFLVK